MWLGDMFSEDSKVSSIRVMAQESLIFAFILAILGMYMDIDLVKVSILCGVFISPVFAKAYQKGIELKQSPKGQT